MKHFCSAAVIILSSIVLLTMCSRTMTKPEVLTSIESYTNLIWSDEFNGKQIDVSNWSYETEATGWSKTWNQEKQDYIDNGSGGANAFVTNGVLTIRGVRVESGKYTSARMITKGKQSWKYGHIAARIKLPYGSGIWPAFWMLGDNYDTFGWPDCGEIDIMEFIGGSTGKAHGGGDNVSHGTLHGPGYSGEFGIHRKFTLTEGDFKDNFHIFEITWNTNGISWFVDGTNFHSVARKTQWPFDKKFYILLNLAVGGTWPGYPDSATVFPQDMVVDWVRVYQ